MSWDAGLRMPTVSGATAGEVTGVTLAGVARDVRRCEVPGDAGVSGTSGS
jgi:hypothetical protein